jgi:hypothetical protein
MSDSPPPSLASKLRAHAPIVIASAASVILLTLRLYAADILGFGDAEALYASYAHHPQPVYVDHPGLIGVLARLIGGGAPPSPATAHRVTSVLATAAPWLGALAARAAGASPNRAAIAAIALLVTPEIAVGLFGMTPDLPLIILWYASLAASLWALTGKAGSMRTLIGALVGGAAAGLAFDAKVSGALLLAGLTLAWASRHARAHLRTSAPWAGLLLALVMISPVVMDEVGSGFPMLRHRLIDTQKDAGVSLRNVGALLGGQLLYVTPPILLGAYFAARDLHRRRHDDPSSYLLWSTTIASIPLILVCLVSRVAEPHWVAPLYLALPVHLARRPSVLRPRLARSAIAVGATIVALAHAWVLLPLGPWLLGRKYEPRYDLANDLYAWRNVLPVVRNALVTSATETPPILIGPHWTVCAQLHAALPASVLVGCRSDIPDDFSHWLPASTWQHAPSLLYVSDDRFPLPFDLLQRRRVEGTWGVEVRRGGQVVRRVTIWQLVASALTLSVPPNP